MGKWLGGGLALSLYLCLVCTGAAGRGDCLSEVLSESSALSAETEFELGAWQAVGLRYSVLRRWWETELHPTKQGDFLASAAALTRLFLEGASPKLLVPAGSLRERFNQEREQIGGCDLISVGKKYLGEPWWLNRLRPLWLQAWDNRIPIDFSILLNRGRIATPFQNESWAVAQALRAGLREKDPHSSLDPLAVQRKQMADTLRVDTTSSEPQLRPKYSASDSAVKWRLLKSGSNKLGWIQLSRFSSENVVTLVRRAVHDFHRAGAEGLVLDLRQNPGGTWKLLSTWRRYS